MHEYEFKHLEATRPAVSIRKATKHMYTVKKEEFVFEEFIQT